MLKSVKIPCIQSINSCHTAGISIFTRRSRSFSVRAQPATPLEDEDEFRRRFPHARYAADEFPREDEDIFPEDKVPSEDKVPIGDKFLSSAKRKTKTIPRKTNSTVKTTFPSNSNSPAKTKTHEDISPLKRRTSQQKQRRKDTFSEDTVLLQIGSVLLYEWTNYEGGGAAWTGEERACISKG